MIFLPVVSAFGQDATNAGNETAVKVFLPIVSMGTETNSAEDENATPVDPTAVPAPAPADQQGDLGNPEALDTDNDVHAAGVCAFTMNGDYVHVSSTAFEASGHGWWVNGNCNATLALVTVQLQQYYSDGTWRNVGTAGSATVSSGGGAGNRSTGRATCTSSSVTRWRSVIDVDVIGVLDPPDKLTTSTRNISCRS